MHGVYVLDLDSGHVYMQLGDTLQAVIDAFMEEQQRRTVPVEAKIDGSYHYFPCLAGETDDDAEHRVFKMISRQYGPCNVWARLAFRETLAKGTWSPGSAAVPDSTPSSVNEEKGGVFSISI